MIHRRAIFHRSRLPVSATDRSADSGPGWHIDFLPLALNGSIPPVVSYAKLYSAARTLIKTSLLWTRRAYVQPVVTLITNPLAHERRKTRGTLPKHTLRLEDRYQVRLAQIILFHQKLERPT